MIPMAPLVSRSRTTSTASKRETLETTTNKRGTEWRIKVWLQITTRTKSTTDSRKWSKILWIKLETIMTMTRITIKRPIWIKMPREIGVEVHRNLPDRTREVDSRETIVTKMTFKILWTFLRKIWRKLSAMWTRRMSTLACCSRSKTRMELSFALRESSSHTFQTLIGIRSPETKLPPLLPNSNLRVWDQEGQVFKKWKIWMDLKKLW